MTRREKVEAYRTTRSYRRLAWRVAAMSAVWALACFLNVSFPREARIFSLGINLAFWSVAGLLMWSVVRLILLFSAVFIPDAKLQRHLREGVQDGAA